jgi:hypothetical protein
MTRFREDIFEWRAKLVACLLAESESEPVSFRWMLKSLQHRVVVGRRACQPSASRMRILAYRLFVVETLGRS